MANVPSLVGTHTLSEYSQVVATTTCCMQLLVRELVRCCSAKLIIFISGEGKLHRRRYVTPEMIASYLCQVLELVVLFAVSCCANVVCLCRDQLKLYGKV